MSFKEKLEKISKESGGKMPDETKHKMARATQELKDSDVVAALESWQPLQLELGNYLRELGISLGTRLQFSSR